MEKDLWTWAGKHVGAREGDDLWTYAGRHVGRFLGDEVYDPTGLYLGEVMDGDRLITERKKRRQRQAAFAPLARRPAHARRVVHAGHVMYDGYQDFPLPESFG
jgi:hypothetical protein